MMQVPCSSPRGDSPEKSTFSFVFQEDPQSRPQSRLYSDDDFMISRHPRHRQRPPKEDEEHPEETESSTHSDNEAMSEGEASDDQGLQVFEDNDSEEQNNRVLEEYRHHRLLEQYHQKKQQKEAVEEARRQAEEEARRQLILEQERRQQQQKNPHMTVVEHYRVVEQDAEDDTGSYESSEAEHVSATASSSTNQMELVTVERWAVDHGGQNRAPASLMISSGFATSEDHTPTNSILQGATSSSTSATSRPLQPLTKVNLRVGTRTASVHEADKQQATAADNDPKDGIQSACKLVQAIYDQMILHDSPAVNETVVPDSIEQQLSLVEEGEVGAPPTPINRVSKQRHDATGAPSTNAGNKSKSKKNQSGKITHWSFDTEETTSNASSYLKSPNEHQIVGVQIHRLGGALKGAGESENHNQDNHSFFQHLKKQPPSKMGHVALGTLCSWTLDTVQPPVPPQQVTTNKPLASPTKATTPRRFVPQRLTTTTGGGGSTKEKSGNNNKWKLKKVWKKKKKPVSGTSAEIVVSSSSNVGGSFTKRPTFSDLSSQTNHYSRNTPKEGPTCATALLDDRFDHDASSSTTPRHIECVERRAPSSPSPRLKMFGSEYARFLSTSALAPRIRSPRNIMPQKSASSRYGPFAATNHMRKRNQTSNISAGIQAIMSSNSFASARSKVSASTKNSWNLEDQDQAILTGAIVDICITNGSDTPPPKGYYRISQTVDGEEFRGALRAGGSGGASSPRKKSSTYINVKKEPSWHRAAQRPCVTALTIIFPDRQEFVPPGFCVVREHRRSPTHHKHQSKSGSASVGSNSDVPGGGDKGSNKGNSKEESDTTIKDQPANFNTGVVDGERVFLCFRRSREANPITGILPLQPAFDEAIPDGYTVLERSPRNFVASLNPSGSPVFLAYRQRLANLEPLRPLPLLLSVPVTTHCANTDEDASSQVSGLSRPSAATTNKRPKLSAYYCTGGTVVEANVGRYHIMDRSTHDLLSPSSVANRLSLIELSRRKSMPQLAGEYDAIGAGARLARTEAASEPPRPPTQPTATQQSHFLQTYNPPTRDLVMAQSCQISVASSTDKSSHNMSFGSTSLAEYPKHSAASCSSRDSSLSMDHVNEDDSGVPSVILSSFPGSNQQAEGYYQKLYDTELQQNHDALNFIPVVEIAVHHHPSQLEPLKRLCSRTALLTPILTACYQRHGGAALKAVEGLTQLLTETTFFVDDVDRSTSNSKASTRLTLLDISVQVVCDVAMGGAQETTFGTCVEFVERALKFSKGHLNTRTVGYVLRFYLFVFYFGASVPATKSFPHANWATPRHRHPQGGPNTMVTVPMPILYDPRIEEKTSYLPGGAPQLAALSFKELISLTLCRLQQVCVEAPAKQKRKEGFERQSMGDFLDGIISSVVDRAVHRVDIANFTQMAIHQIHRSGGSELFWHDMMTSCGMGLFGRESEVSEEVQNMFVIAFAMLANLVKVASGKIRTNAQTMDLRPRDVSSKLLSLELLLHFLEHYAEQQTLFANAKHSRKDGSARCAETMVFSIRRLVVPCILANTRAGLEDPRVFQRMAQIMSVLWRTKLYRDRMKGEMGMLIEHFALRLLRLGPQMQQTRLAVPRVSDKDDLSCPLLTQQLDLLKEIKRWFSSNPKATIEMYLNFDTDITSHDTGPSTHLLPGTQWKVFQRVCASLCNLAEQCGDLIGEQIRRSQSTATPDAYKMRIPFYFDTAAEIQSAENKEAKLAEQKAIREGARRLRKAALDAIVQILKCLARTSAAATGRQFYVLVSSWSDPNDPDDFGEAHLSGVESRESKDSDESSVEYGRNEQRQGGAGGILKFWQKEQETHQEDFPTPRDPKSFKPFNYNFESQSGLLSSVTRQTAFEIARRKSVKKAVEYLIACNALTPSPRDIAAFLRVHKDMLDQGALGTYLGESGIDGQETEYWNLVRFSYVRAISFDGMNVEEALRHFLTNCGFQLPGEAQKIDRIMTTFAQCYWEDNAGDMKNCPFQDQDTVFLLSFAIIMLNTDLHKTSLSSNSTSRSKGGRKRITKQEFLKNLSGVEGSEELRRDYLSAVYDSIEADPIILANSDQIGAQTLVGPAEGRERMLRSMLGNVRSADALLRGLSVHDVKWASMQDFSSSLDYEGAHALSDLTQSCISEAWHQFHGVVNTALETAHLDPQGMEPCVDLLKYALVVTICLDLPMERSAFLSQLGRFKVFERNSSSNKGHWVPDAEQGRLLVLQGNPAFDRAIAGPLDEQSKLKALVQVHEATQDLRSALKVDIQVKEQMNRVTHQILDGDFLLNDPSRSFVRMSDLKKKSNLSGRFTEYRFYLFSDVLIYAKRTTSSAPHHHTKEGGHRRNGSFSGNITLDDRKDEFKIHEELPLHLMKVVDWFPPSTIKDMMKKAFQVHHPRKTFMVFCNSPEERVAWVRDIRSAINREIQRKVEMEAARMAAASMTPSTPVRGSDGLSISTLHAANTPRPPF